MVGAPHPSAGESDPRSQSVDVRILWGDAVLLVAELAPPRPLFVGSDDVWADGEARSACALPACAIGARRAALVDVELDGGVSVFVPPGASAELVDPAQPTRTRAELVSDGVGRRCDAIPGALRVRLPLGSRLRIESAGVVFEVSHGDASSKIPRARFEARGATWTVVSAAVHLALLAVLAGHLVPLDVGVGGEAPMVDVAFSSFGRFVAVTAEPELAMPDADVLGAVARRGADLGSDDGGARPLGAPTAPHAQSRYGVAGPTDNPDPHIARDASTGETRFFAFPGIDRPFGGDFHAPLAPWGRDDSLGNDPLSARGEMWGDEISESFGAAGLGVAGESECGCGSARALATGEIQDLLQIVRAIDPPKVELAAAARHRAILRTR